MGLASCSVVIDSLVICALIVWMGVVIGPYYALLNGLSLLKSSGWGRKAGCFTLLPSC